MELHATPAECLHSLYQAEDLIQSFLNCYVLCDAHSNTLIDLLKTDRWDIEYGNRTGVFRELLENNAPAFQFEAELEPASDDDALVRAAALMTALARHLAEHDRSDLTRYSKPYSSSALFGQVLYWLAVEREGLLHRKIPRRPRDPNQLSDTLRRHHEPLVVIPARLKEGELVRVVSDAKLEDWFERRAGRDRLLIGVTSLSCEAELRGQSHRRENSLRPHAFHLTSAEPSQREALEKVLRSAYDQGIGILVLPELRMPPELLDQTREFLRTQQLTDDRGLLLVVAGSWHVEVGDSHCNRCTVLNHFGEDLWVHDKLREVEFTPENVARAPEFFARCGVGPEGGFENITRGRRLEFYDSVVGRVAVAICIGFFLDEIRPLLLSSQANVFCVPSMTPSVVDIERLSEDLVRSQHAFSFVANCGVVGKVAPSFCRWPATGRNVSRLANRETLLALDLNDISIHNSD
jgi:predicted amidohydrolase